MALINQNVGTGNIDYARRVKSVRVGVVGAGFAGENHARVYSESPIAELTAIVDLKPERARDIAKKYGAKSWYTSVHEMLEKQDIDAVSVTTPEAFHKGPAVAAEMAKKHVFVEKPIADTMADAIAIVDLARKNKIKLMVGYILRFDPRYAEAKKTN